MTRSLPDTVAPVLLVMDKITHRTWFRTLIEGLVEPHVFFMKHVSIEALVLKGCPSTTLNVTFNPIPLCEIFTHKVYA